MRAAIDNDKKVISTTVVQDDSGKTITLVDGQDWFDVEIQKQYRFVRRIVIVTYDAAGQVSTVNIIKRTWGYILQREDDLQTADDDSFNLEDGEEVVVLEADGVRRVVVAKFDDTRKLIYTRKVSFAVDGTELLLAENQDIKVEITDMGEKIIRRLILISVDTYGNKVTKYVKITIGDKEPWKSQAIIDKPENDTKTDGYNSTVGNGDNISKKTIQIEIRVEYIKQDEQLIKVITIGKRRIVDGVLLGKIVVTKPDNTILVLSDTESIAVTEDVIDGKVVRKVYVVDVNSIGSEINRTLVYTLVGEDAPTPAGEPFSLDITEIVTEQIADNGDGTTTNQILVVKYNEDRSIEYLRDLTLDDGTNLFIRAGEKAELEISADEDNNLFFRIFVLKYDETGALVSRKFIHLTVGPIRDVEPSETSDTYDEDDINRSLYGLVNAVSTDKDDSFGEVIKSLRRW